MRVDATDITVKKFLAIIIKYQLAREISPRSNLRHDSELMPAMQNQKMIKYHAGAFLRMPLSITLVTKHAKGFDIDLSIVCSDNLSQVDAGVTIHTRHMICDAHQAAPADVK